MTPDARTTPSETPAGVLDDADRNVTFSGRKANEPDRPNRRVDSASSKRLDVPTNEATYDDVGCS